MEIIHNSDSFLMCPTFREKLSQFLNNSRTEDGSFVMHKDGEVDIRYCMLFSVYEITLVILAVVFIW